MDDVDDVLKTVNFFREMKAINREFFCDMQVNESDRVKNIFWANASCRGAYQDFGDCVTFDTTYKTNKYHMPLGVFVGTNNHLQTTFFAFALIRDEDADSFKWLFKTFLRCMRMKAPTYILTGTTAKSTPNNHPPSKKEKKSNKKRCVSSIGIYTQQSLLATQSLFSHY